MTVGAVPRPGQQEPTVAQTSYNRIARANVEFQQHLDTCARDARHYSEEGQKDRIRALADSEAAKAVDAAENAAIEDERMKQQKVDEIRNEMNTNAGDAATQTLAQRYWEREQPILDALDAGKAAHTARQAMSRANPVDRAVLAEELPAWLESKGLPTDWIEPVLAQVNPELGQAKRELAEATHHRTVISFDANAVRTGIANGHPAYKLVDPATLR
jgi:hypothetical protein